MLMIPAFLSASFTALCPNPQKNHGESSQEGQRWAKEERRKGDKKKEQTKIR